MSVSAILESSTMGGVRNASVAVQGSGSTRGVKIKRVESSDKDDSGDSIDGVRRKRKGGGLLIRRL